MTETLREIELNGIRTTELNRLAFELKVALDRVDGDPAGLNEVTALYLAQQANLFRSGIRRGAAVLEEKERERTAAREVVNG